jgi:hypothetical protein
MFNHDRDSMRQYFLDSWRKARDGRPLEPLEQRIADVIREHPEYHALLDTPDTALTKEFLPEGGQTNPFLHLSLHIAILEQVGTDRPVGVRGIYQRLLNSLGDAHEVEHLIMDCLAQSLWESQRLGRPPDQAAYVECLKRSVGKKIPSPRV